MRLDRNINPNRKGKYALILLRKIQGDLPELQDEGTTNSSYEVPQDAVDFGDTHDTDFFVIRLKDKYAYKALDAYAREAAKDDPEYGREIAELALKAMKHPSKKMPD